MTEPLPFCTECNAPRIAVFELADGTTRCTMCIERGIDEAEVELHRDLRRFLDRTRTQRKGYEL